MEIKVRRIAKRQGYTIGRLYVDGRYFCDTLEDADRGLGSGMPLEKISRLKVYGQTAIPTGRYAVTLGVVSPRFKDRAWAKPYGGKVPRLLNVPGFDGVLIHCLHPDMEILTEKGWLNLKGFEKEHPQQCWSLNIQTGKMELVPIDKYIVEDYVGELYCCEYPQGRYNNVSYRVTDRHRMLCTLPLAYGSDLRFVEARDIPKKATFIAAGESASTVVLDDTTMTMCKLCMHIVADGYVRWYKLANGEHRVTITFHYKKARKINHVITLLKQAGLRHSVNTNKDGSTVIRILTPDCERLALMVDPNRQGKDGKHIPQSFTTICSKQMLELIEEYHFADGKYTDMKQDTFAYQICSTNMQTIDTLQTMAFLCGLSSSGYYDRYKQPKWKDAMTLSLQKNYPTRTPVDAAYYKEPYNGKVFCVQNRNHTIVARNSRGDVPFVLGNCGNDASDTSGCILVGRNTVVGKVADSTATFHALMGKLLAAKGDIWLSVE